MADKVTEDHSTTTRHRPARRSADRPVPRRRAAGGDLFAHGDAGIRKLYTVPMMAAVLRVPIAAVRHWIRGGLLVATRRAQAIEWFDFQQLVVGRQLGRLLDAGLSLREIDAKLAVLMPDGAPAAARVAERIVIDGRRLSIRHDGRLLGGGGQLQFSFLADGPHDASQPRTIAPRIAEPAIVPHTWSPADEPDPTIVPIDPSQADVPPSDCQELLDLAADLEAAGEFTEAAEALRAALQAGGADPQTMFMLAELLYRSGDMTAARERYYATIELDADHLEARASLGCVLAELGEHELALAALEGVLRQEPDYADAHWHIASVLHEIGSPAEAKHHLRQFLALAPESPWATLARERLR